MFLRSFAQGLSVLLASAMATCWAGDQTPLPSAKPWRPDHTVIVVLENLSAHEATASQHAYGNAPVYGHVNWQYFNALAAKGAQFNNAHFGRTPYGSGVPTRPSQPNYLYLFSGHHQGVLSSGVANNSLPDEWLPLTSPNLGAAILKTGGSFASFSESLPYPSWNCATDSALVACNVGRALTDYYRRKHNPTINWTDQIQPNSARGLQGDLAHHVLPISVNLGFEPTQDPALKRAFRGFIKDAQGHPLAFDQLPTVSVVIPNEQNDAHSNTARMADDWLKTNLGAYAQWALKHNSLLIVTFDEDGSTDASKGDPYQTGAHRIPLIFYGAGVKPGVVDRRVDHLNVLSTVLWLHGALESFKADFRQHHKVVDGSGSEAEKEFQNLLPITDIFAARR
ncbi:MAG: hypothetical protein KGL90_02425 [Burkholderiales bacterium]|nr:hypothetical protein [Burkholderiales bacterium]